MGFIEELAKTFTAALALLTALGLPAVAIQMYRLSVPVAAAGGVSDVFVSSINREMGLRAGVVPAIIFAFVAWAVRIWLAYNKSIERRMAGIPRTPTNVGLIVGVTILVAFGFSLFSAVHIIGRLVTIHFHKDRTLHFVSIEIVLCAVLAIVFVLWQIIANKRGTRGPLAVLINAVAKGDCWQRAPETKLPMWFSVLISLWIFFAAWLPIWADYHLWNRSPYFTNDWKYILTGASVAGGAVVFVAEVMQNLTEIAVVRWYKRPLWLASLMYFYLPFAVFWSVYWYPRIPYAWGGGKPSVCTVWVEQKKFADSLGTKLSRVRKVNDHESIRLENAFRVYVGSDAVILADSDDPFAQAVFLPRDSIQGIAHK